jgi:hypothetical protein
MGVIRCPLMTQSGHEQLGIAAVQPNPISKCVLAVGTRSAQNISASGHTAAPYQCCSSVKNSCHGAVQTSKPTLYVTLNGGICYHLIDLSVLFCRGRHVRRRELVTFVSGASPFWSVAARAQHSALLVIAFLSGASLEAMRDYLTVFKQSLAETGFTEGRDVAIVVGASTPRALVAEAADNQCRSQPFLALQSVYCSAVTNDSRLVSTAHASRTAQAPAALAPYSSSIGNRRKLCDLSVCPQLR